MDSRPTIPVEIDQNHAHVTGLQAAYIFNNTCKDYRGNFNLNPVTGTYDTGLRCDANGEYAKLDNTAQVIGSEQGTIVLKFTSDSVFNDSAMRGIFSRWGGGVYVEGNFFIFKHGNNNLYIGFRDATLTHRISVTSTKIPNWQTGTQMGIQWDINNAIYDSKNIALCVDDSYVIPDTSANATSWASFAVNSSIYVGNDSANSNYHCNGVIEYLYIYNTVLSEATLADIYSSPYAMFKAKPLSIYIPEKPTETPAIEIPLDHEHADGLQAAYLFNEGGGKVFDWTQNQNDLSITNASWVTNGLECNGISEYALLDNTNQIINSEECTVIMGFKSNSLVTDGVLHPLMDNYISGGGAEGSITVTKWSTNTLYFQFYDSVGNHFINISNSELDTWQENIQIAAVLDKNNVVYASSNMGLNINGTFRTPASKGNDTSWNSFNVLSNIPFGTAYKNQVYYANGIFSYVYLYNKALLEDTIKSIYNDPYSMFKSRSAFYLALMGSYKSGLKTKNIHYGANAFPIGRGL